MMMRLHLGRMETLLTNTCVSLQPRARPLFVLALVYHNGRNMSIFYKNKPINWYVRLIYQEGIRSVAGKGEWLGGDK